jgi:ATP-dependent RNA helicase DeaD
VPSPNAICAIRKHVKIQTKTQTVTAIEQAHLLVHADQKTSAVLSLLEVEDFDALIMFVRTKQATLDLASALDARGYKAAALNGDIAQNQRERVIDSLKDGRLDIVVATDVAARGLDVPRITHVFNVDMPYDPESYVHRIGRTGRAGREGRALLLVTPRERRMLQVIERVTGQKVAEVRLPDAQAVLDARIKKLTNSLVAAGCRRRVDPRRPAGSSDCRHRLHAACSGRSPAAQGHQRSGADPGSHRARASAGSEQRPAWRPSGAYGDRPDRGERERRAPVPLGEGRARCRTALGARDGIAAKNLLGAILNEGGLAREAIGRIQVRDSFSLVELPEDGLERLLTKLKDTRVAGKQLKLRRYRED